MSSSVRFLWVPACGRWEREEMDVPVHLSSSNRSGKGLDRPWGSEYRHCLTPVPLALPGVSRGSVSQAEFLPKL